MAKAVGVAASTVWAVWKAHGLMPHRWRPFTLSNDPACLEKLTDIVGLSVAPPAHAVVLSTDDTSHSQARDRTQPGLPLKKGRGATMTHDYKRNGTTTLFAALTVLDGTVRAARQSASPPGVPEIPQSHRAHDTRRRPGPCHPRQRRHSQAQGSPSLARTPSAASSTNTTLPKPSPSSGPPIPIPSSPQEKEGSKC